jgi:hypothetical protein
MYGEVDDTCEDFPLDWKDSSGSDCLTYESETWCTSDGAAGSGDQNSSMTVVVAQDTCRGLSLQFSLLHAHTFALIAVASPAAIGTRRGLPWASASGSQCMSSRIVSISCN